MNLKEYLSKLDEALQKIDSSYFIPAVCIIVGLFLLLLGLYNQSIGNCYEFSDQTPEGWAVMSSCDIGTGETLIGFGVFFTILFLVLSRVKRRWPHRFRQNNAEERMTAEDYGWQGP